MMKASELLLERTRDIWRAYNEHPFVRGIESGTLDKDRFRYYIIQDYLYLEDYAKVFAIGAAKAQSPGMARLFGKYISQLDGGEMDIHQGYMGRLGVSREELEGTPRALTNLSYTSYMLRAAYEGGEAEALAAILSCAYSYEVIARRILENRPEAINDPFYGDWVRGYASEEYSRDNAELIGALDRVTAGYTHERLEHLADIFTACSRYELNFWQMAWDREI